MGWRGYGNAFASGLPKSERPGDAPGPCNIACSLRCQRSDVVVADFALRLRARLRGRKALEALEQLFLGHAVGGDLGIVGVDTGAGRADQRHVVELRLVD